MTPIQITFTLSPILGTLGLQIQLYLLIGNIPKKYLKRMENYIPTCSIHKWLNYAASIKHDV